MSEELFTRKETSRDLFNAAINNLSYGLFQEAIKSLDKIMSIDFNYPLLYENIALIKFWINRIDKINSFKDNSIELAFFLDICFKKFSDFIKQRSIDETLPVIRTIHNYVYKKIITCMTLDTKGEAEGKDAVLLLARSFLELKDLKHALHTFEFLNKRYMGNGYVLGYLSDIYYQLKDERTSKMYLRDAVFYGVFEIDDENMLNPLFKEIYKIIESRGVHSKDKDQIKNWMSAYSELMNILDVKRPFYKGEEELLRKSISKLEAEHRKINVREKTSPKLLAHYAWLTTSLIMNKNEEDAHEIAILGRKMALIDKELVAYYIKLLDLER